MEVFMKIRTKIAATALAFAVTVGCASALTGCSENSGPVTEDVTSAVAVELDYSMYSSTMLYDTMAQFSATSQHMGKTVKIRAEYGAVFDFSTNSFVNVVEQYDATACCAAYYPIVLGDGVKKPALGSKMEMVGTFSDGYITVSAITLFSGCFEDTEIDVNATAMSATEIVKFTNTVRSLNNSYVGQTVRISGHYAMSQDGFSYLIGYEEGSEGKLNSTWSVEIHSETVEFPEINDNYVRAYEVVGTVSSYKTPDGNEWPCIEVKSIRAITTYSI